MATQTYAGLTAEQKTFYDRALLTRLLPNLVFQKYGQKKSIPSNSGDTTNFRKFNSLAANTTPLQEGVTPSGNALDVSSITAKIEQYGGFVEISDKLDMVGIDPVLTETAKLLGEQAGLTLDTVVRDVVCTGTNVQYAGGAASTATVTAKITATEIMKAVRTLRAANA
ncbi:MAG: N4-gp56 family major capsid protein, partial [Oscillospiraceae bacterium]